MSLQQNQQSVFPFKNKFRNNQDAESVIGKSLPANIDAEKSVLAALLLNGDNITLVSDTLKSVDFYLKHHQILYQALLELAQTAQKIDLVVLKDYLETKELLDAAGGLMYLMELQEDIPSIGLINQHAKIVKDKAILRDLIHSAADIITTCYDQKIEEIDAVLDAAEKKIYAISHKLTAPTFVQLDELLKKTFKHLADVKSH